MLNPISCKAELHNVGGDGRFILGDCEAAAAGLLPLYRERIQLIYLDPPFGTGESFVHKAGKKSEKTSVPAYSDTMGQKEYLATMERVLTLCHELLAPDGSLYLHVDYRMAPYLRILLDKLFGASNFMNEIIWSYKSGGRSKNHYSRKHDNILFYRKSSSVFFDIESVGTPRGPQRRNHMKRQVSPDGVVTFSIKAGNKVYTYPETSLVFPSDVWDDIEHLHQRDPERTGYATQKPEALLSRIITASSEAGAYVLDMYAGSGTTAAAAASLDRKWICIDSSPVSLMVTRNRMIDANINVTLFNSRQLSRFEYDSCRNSSELAEYIDIENITAAGQLQLTVKKPLAYAAIGSIDDTVFIPGPRRSFPRAGEILTSAANGMSRVIHIVSYDGRQLFAEYSD